MFSGGTAKGRQCRSGRRRSAHEQRRWLVAGAGRGGVHRGQCRTLASSQLSHEGHTNSAPGCAGSWRWGSRGSRQVDRHRSCRRTLSLLHLEAGGASSQRSGSHLDSVLPTMGPHEERRAERRGRDIPSTTVDPAQPARLTAAEHVTSRLGSACHGPSPACPPRRTLPLWVDSRFGLAQPPAPDLMGPQEPQTPFRRRAASWTKAAPGLEAALTVGTREALPGGGGR